MNMLSDDHRPSSIFERLMADQHRIEALTRPFLENRALEHILGDQRRIEALIQPLLANHPLEQILVEQQRWQDLVRNAPVNQMLDLTAQRFAAEDAMHATRVAMSGIDALRAAAESLRSTSSLPELLGPNSTTALSGIVGSAASIQARTEINGLYPSMAYEATIAKHLTRVADLDRLLYGTLPEPAYLEWSAHLRTAAAPTFSFLTQEREKPYGLMVDLGASLGASIAWKTRRRDESIIHVAAVTEAEDAPDIDVDARIVCMGCKLPMPTFQNEGLAWIGPRRGVFRCQMLPVCPVCFRRELETPGYLREVFSRLSSPTISITLTRIRGGGQGDGRSKGKLRLVGDEPPQPDA